MEEIRCVMACSDICDIPAAAGSGNKRAAFVLMIESLLAPDAQSAVVASKAILPRLRTSMAITSRKFTASVTAAYGN
jgi:hypothetical protein